MGCHFDRTFHRFCCGGGGCEGMLGSPRTQRTGWPEPPPAHNNGYGRLVYSVGESDGGSFGVPRLAHVSTPQTYPPTMGGHKVEEQQVFTGFSRSVSQVQLVPKSETSKSSPKPLQSTRKATGGTSGGIPVGIAVARQRVQQNTPPPLTVVTCEERSTNQVTGWPLAPHWQYPGVEQSLPLQPPQMGLQLARDPISNGHFLLLPANNIDSMQRTVVWPGCGPTNVQPPPLQVMQPTQPVLLDRLVALAPPQSDKRRTMEDGLASVMLPCDFSKSTGGSSTSGPPLLSQPSGNQGLALIHNLTATTAPTAAPTPTGLLNPNPFGSVLIHQMPFSQQNNSLLLSTQLTEQSLINQNLNTSVVISNQLSENTVINPQLIGSFDSFGAQSGLIQHMSPSLVISHTETNSFVRSDINTVFPVDSPKIVLKEEIKSEPEEKQHTTDQATSPPECLSLSHDTTSQGSEEEVKEVAACQDASNQTETPSPSDEDSCPEKPKFSPKEEEVKVEQLPAQVVKCMVKHEILGQKEEIEEKVLEKKEIEMSTRDSTEESKVGKEEPFSPESRGSEAGMEEDEPTSGPAPDLSGLELLSNSIMHYESVKVEKESPAAESSVEGDEGSDEEKSPMDSSKMYGGLGILCELAHQRFIEETQNDSSSSSSPESHFQEDKAKSSMVSSMKRDLKKGSNREWKVTSGGSKDRNNLFEPLSAVPIKASIKRGPGRPRKSPSRPVKKARLSVSSSSSSNEPPILEPWCTSPNEKADVLSPPLLTPHKRKSSESPIHSQDSDGSSSGSGRPPPLSPACSSSKKRKVGRPKKRAEKPMLTETLVSKPMPSNKVVGLLLAKKSPEEEEPKSHKIRPKLKAEVKVKSWSDEDDTDLCPPKDGDLGSPDIYSPPWTYCTKDKGPDTLVSRKIKAKPLEKKVPRKPIMLTMPKIKKEEPVEPVTPTPLLSPPVLKPVDVDCTMTLDKLNSLPCRVLVARGGLFYAGELTEVDPPDIYGVTLDRERGHKPHIYCREQVLSDTILEVKCDGLPLTSGIRLCAYWSDQYRCLYPGTVCSDSSPEDKFIYVEFDDGDNGKISRDDIRLLPANYPIVEYDPNPLSSLGKRRRHNSTNSCDSVNKVAMSEVAESVIENESNQVISSPMCNYQDYSNEGMEPSSIGQSRHSSINTLSSEETKVSDSFSESDKTLSTESPVDSEQERRRLKKKKKEKMREKLEGGDSHRHRHRHKDGCRSHKHKHKHRHRKHKHRHRDGGFEMKIKDSTVIPHENGEPPLFHGPLVTTIVNNFKDKEKKKEHKKKEEVSKEEETVNEEVEEEKESDASDEEDMKSSVKGKKGKERRSSGESKSKIAAFLPARQLWTWSGKGFKRGKGISARGRRKTFYKSIQRGKETITVGDCAVFLSTGRPDRPYIGRIESMWECWGSNMLVRVSWFYHPEETIGCPDHLPYPGALFESPHHDENDVQTISHKCEVLPLPKYRERVQKSPQLLETIYDNNDMYYLAGFYDPTNISLKLEPGVE